MNKLLIIFVFIGIAGMVFSIGYKLGDAKGYEEGYQVGYLYDCREELKVLRDRVENHEKAVEFTDKQIRSLSRQNDSLRRPGIYDSMHARFTRDSLKYYKQSRSYNDSLRKVTGSSIRNIILDDGRINTVACLLDDKLKNLPECKGDWRIDK